MYMNMESGSLHLPFPLSASPKPSGSAENARGEAVESRWYSRRSGSAEFWNRTGYWFLNVGVRDHRDWEDCRQYGFVAAGHGVKYSKQLERLSVDDAVFAYVKGEGYVGYGEVVSKAVPVSEFEVDGEPVLSRPLKNPGLGHDADDLQLREWLVGIRWERTFSIEEAKTFKGVFANQNLTCKLRHRETVKFVEREFGVGEKRA